MASDIFYVKVDKGTMVTPGKILLQFKVPQIQFAFKWNNAFEGLPIKEATKHEVQTGISSFLEMLRKELNAAVEQGTSEMEELLDLRQTVKHQEEAIKKLRKNLLEKNKEVTVEDFEDTIDEDVNTIHNSTRDDDDIVF